jgi:exodeoxyribonuclease VII large subunit
MRCSLSLRSVEQIALSLAPQRRYLTVTEFAFILRGFLEQEFGDVWLAGEISGCKLSSAGHYYFTLKDSTAQLRCACFRGSARYLKFKPQDGIAVLARGRADLYAERGDLQFIVEAIEPQGHGALQLAFEQLKKKLALEGLFEASRKRPLPKLPQRIGIVTSPQGAVIRDMLNVLSRRFPGLHIRLYPALVQGEGSIEAVCRGIDVFSRSAWADVVIVARGGGSLEDLWTFNEEAVARAIAQCSMPVISAVGHETDFTIADFVADLRAPTPSAAAELVICTRQQILDQIAGCRKKMEQAVHFRIAQAGRRLNQQGIDRATTLLHRAITRRAQRVDEIDYRLRDRIRALERDRKRRLAELEARLRRQDVRLRFAQARHRLENARRAIEQCIRLRLTKANGQLAPAVAHLTQLSPLKILDRGYAIVENEAGRVVKSPGDAPVSSDIRIRLAEGKLNALVTSVKERSS